MRFVNKFKQKAIEYSAKKKLKEKGYDIVDSKDGNCDFCSVSMKILKLHNFKNPKEEDIEMDVCPECLMKQSNMTVDDIKKEMKQ